MKHNIAVFVSFAVFVLTIVLLFGFMGNYECDYITTGQAIKRGLICIVVLGADAAWVTHLGKEKSSESKM